MLDDALSRSLFEMALDPPMQLLAQKLVSGVEATEDAYDSVLVRLDILLRLARNDPEYGKLRDDLWLLREAVERRRVQGQIAFDIHRLDPFVEDGWICGDGFAQLQDYIGYEGQYVSVRSAAQAWLNAHAEDYDHVPIEDLFGWQEIVRAAACLCTDRSWIWRIAELPLLRENLDHLCPLENNNALRVSLGIRNSFPREWMARFDAVVLHASMYEIGHNVLRVGHAVDCAMSVASIFSVVSELEEDDVIVRQIVETAIFAVEQEMSK